MEILQAQELVQLGMLFKVLLHEYAGEGILAGFLHPLLGPSHLLAMIAVGVVSTQIGGRAIWRIPAIFIVTMAVGGLLGLFGLYFPVLEYGITISVVILGIVILMEAGMPTALIMGVVAFFALLHGVAHGAALPDATESIPLTAAYVAGFLIATAGLHLIGAFMGIIIERRENATMIMRVLGGILAAIGIILTIQV